LPCKVFGLDTIEFTSSSASNLFMFPIGTAKKYFQGINCNSSFETHANKQSNLCTVQNAKKSWKEYNMLLRITWRTTAFWHSMVLLEIFPRLWIQRYSTHAKNTSLQVAETSWFTIPCCPQNGFL